MRQGRQVDANPGGKARNLLALKEAGFNVPDFLVIHSDQVSAYLEDENALRALLARHFDQTDRLAVRSSAQAEDGLQKSFAGLFKTVLFVPLEEVRAAMKEVWVSASDPRVLAYSDQAGAVSVIVQRMVDSDISGVAFGANPLTGKKGELLINAVYGLGEALVSGEISADHYQYQNGAWLGQIARKERHLGQNADGTGTAYYPLDPSLDAAGSLNESQLEEIRTELLRIESHFGYPQDIEFAYAGGQLHILQSRPITTLKQTSEKQVIVWDNSNIIESYPGLTLPLTFSFITRMYEAVYLQLSEVMGIRKRDIRRNAGLYANMLGLLRGRVYYNLNSWFGVLALLPGYSLNAELMEKMMGVKEKFTHHQLPDKSKWQAWTDVVYALGKILVNFGSIRRQSLRFQAFFESVYRRYMALDLSISGVDEILSHYRTYEQTLTKKWRAPLVNDFFSMIFYGILNKLSQHPRYETFPNLCNALLTGSNDIVSVGPARKLAEITELIREEGGVEYFTQHTPEEIWRKKHLGEYPRSYSAIDAYIEVWGSRCVGELKLETKTYREDPDKLIRLVQQTLASGSVSIPENTSRRKEAEDFARSRGGLLRRIVFFYVLKKARYFVSNRENLRYERTRGYAVVRKLFNAVGQRMAEAGAITEADDIHYLSLNEITAYTEGKTPDVDLATLIAFRKEQYSRFEKSELPERIQTSGLPYLDLPLSQDVPAEDNADILQGIACCSGVVKARVQVLNTPDEADHLQGRILVTSSTDPGWVPLFLSASGILVERGSMLSHSAIVSREMGLPCIVAVKGLMKNLKSGDLVEMNGATGIIKVLERC